jgi:hypothetical protein
MPSPHVWYEEPDCRHSGCRFRMEFIDFKLELYRDPRRIYNPLVLAFFRDGFAGRCPSCGGWIRFTTSAMAAIGDDEAAGLPHLPDDWHAVAQFA